MGGLLEHIGIEKERVSFSWISSAEAIKFVDVVKEITAKVEAIGPNTKLKKQYN
jgi:coenzyme F420-reducing hydrogenase delta subunit